MPRADGRGYDFLETWTTIRSATLNPCSRRYWGTYGECGAETQRLKDGELLIGRRFILREEAQGLGGRTRREVERGWIDE
jgi:hypothetical protein